MGKHKNKTPPVEGGTKFTFRTFIKELQDNTNLSNSFYRQFNHNAQVDRMRNAFDDNVAATHRKQYKKNKKNKNHKKANGKDDDILLHLNHKLTGLDLQSVGATDTIVSAYRLVNTLPTALEKMYARNQIRKIIGLTKADERHFTDAANSTSNPTQLEIDLIERVTAKYKNDNDILYSIGQYYKENKERKLWHLITKDAVQAELQHIVRNMATNDAQININFICTESIKRLQNECNGEVEFKKLQKQNSYTNNNSIVNIDTLNTATTNIFTNIENTLTASGNSNMYLNNALLRINCTKTNKQIPKVNIYESMPGGRFNMDSVLFNPVDRQINTIKKLYTVDYGRDGLYFRYKFKTNYMPNKKLIQGIDKGKAKNFIHFLDCISGNLSGANKTMFLTAYLDMLAYLIQPIKRHNCFFYIYGLGENGKSFGIKIIESIAGSDKITYKEIENANDNPRFFAAELSDIYAVIEDDLQHFKPELAGVLKKYSNGNTIVSAEIKHTSQLKSYLLKCSMVLLSNKRIIINDTTKGLSRRLYPFTFDTDISPFFDQDRNGIPLLKNELDYVYNLLRYRMPRVIKNGVQHNKLMQKDITKITRGSTVDQLIGKLKHTKKGYVKLSDLLVYVASNLAKMYGLNTRQADRLTIEFIKDKVQQLGFKIDDGKGIILNAKLKTKK